MKLFTEEAKTYQKVSFWFWTAANTAWLARTAYTFYTDRREHKAAMASLHGDTIVGHDDLTADFREYVDKSIDAGRFPGWRAAYRNYRDKQAFVDGSLAQKGMEDTAVRAYVDEMVAEGKRIADMVIRGLNSVEEPDDMEPEVKELIIEASANEALNG